MLSRDFGYLLKRERNFQFQRLEFLLCYKRFELPRVEQKMVREEERRRRRNTLTNESSLARGIFAHFL